MKATGIVRNIDDVGRIVIPKEMRRTLGAKEGDPMEIFVDGNRIVLQKYTECCSLCGITDGELVTYRQSKVCLNCIHTLNEYAQASYTTGD